MNSNKNENSNNKLDKELVFRSVLAFFILIMMVIYLEFSNQVKDLEQVTDSIDDISNINAQMQRLVRMEISGEYANQLIVDIDILINNLDSSQYAILSDSNSDIGIAFIQVKNGWQELKDEVYKARELGWKASRLLYSAETTYYATERLTKYLMNYFTNLPSLISVLHIALSSLFVLILLSLLFRILHQLSIIRNQKDEVYESYLDSSTGLYNRAKCQKLLAETPLELDNTSLILYDLNNLKQTNDNLGHIIGDELISTFANALKEAKSLSTNNPFIGRYGGDEFIVYFETVEENEIQYYLECVDRAVEVFNKTEQTFQVSYAYGYAIANEITEKGTVENLFSLADDRMYKNKVAMKRLNK